MLEVIILIAVGVIAGAINAVAGGGAILIFPVLLWLGLEPVTATATISIAVLPGLLGAIAGYRDELRKVPKLFLWLVLPAVIGAVIGANALATIEPADFERVVPWLVLTAVLLLAGQTKIHRVIVTEKHLVKTNAEVGIIALIISTFVLSLYGGFFGVGVGLMMLAIIGLSSRIKNMYQLSALKVLYVFSIALTAFLFFFANGMVDLVHGPILAIGTAIGGFIAAKYSKHISSHAVHNLAVVLGSVIAVYLFVK